MSRTIKRLNERATFHSFVVNALLPTHCCRGAWHANVIFATSLIDGELVVSVRVDGEDFKAALTEQWSFSAEDLGISSSEEEDL